MQPFCEIRTWRGRWRMAEEEAGQEMRVILARGHGRRKSQGRSDGEREDSLGWRGLGQGSLGMPGRGMQMRKEEDEQRAGRRHSKE
jgi:hypothetical protein